MRILTGLLALSLLVFGGLTAQAEDGTRDVWRFKRGDYVREVDVTDLSPEIRKALSERLVADGFVRLQERSRDYAADIAALVAHGGRFPAPGTTASPEAGPSSKGLPPRTIELELLLRRAARLVTELEAGPAADRGRLADLKARLEAEDLPSLAEGRVMTRLLAALERPTDGAPSSSSPRRGRPPLFLGAVVRPASPSGGGPLVVMGVPDESMAAAAGLAVGDVILELDGKAPETAALAAWARAFPSDGQRRLRIRRRSGRLETWDIRCEPGDRRPPASRSR